MILLAHLIIVRGRCIILCAHYPLEHRCHMVWGYTLRFSLSVGLVVYPISSCMDDTDTPPLAMDIGIPSTGCMIKGGYSPAASHGLIVVLVTETSKCSAISLIPTVMKVKLGSIPSYAHPQGLVLWVYNAGRPFHGLYIHLTTAHATPIYRLL